MGQAKETSRHLKHTRLIGALAAWPFRKRSKQPHSSDLPLQSFRFLDLPRELRDQIYHLALLRHVGPELPRTPADVISRWDDPRVNHACSKPGRNWFFYRKKGKIYWRAYWGTERATRLFRVNRQVSEESLQLFYSRFRFQVEFCPRQKGLFHKVLCDTLPSSSVALIKNIQFTLGFYIPWDPESNFLTCRYTDSELETMIDEVTCLLPRFKEGQGRTFINTNIILLSGPLGPTAETAAVELIAGRLEKCAKFLGRLKSVQYLASDGRARPARIWERIMERLNRGPCGGGVTPEVRIGEVAWRGCLVHVREDSVTGRYVSIEQ